MAKLGNSIDVSITGTHGQFGTMKPPTADDLRKQAKELDKRVKRQKAYDKAQTAKRKRKAKDRETVRIALLRVVKDESKGYASVEAAEALSTLGFI